MPNGNETLRDLEFEQHLGKMDDRALLEFNARQTYEMARGMEVIRGDIKVNSGDIKANKRRSWANRIAILIIIIVLIVIGVVDPSLIGLATLGGVAPLVFLLIG